MQYFEHGMIFYPDTKVSIKFNELNGIWIGKVPAFPDVIIQSPFLNDVILDIETILNEQINFITNDRKKKLVSEIRQSNMVIEYWGEYYLSICKINHSEVFRAIAVKQDIKYEWLPVDKIIDEEDATKLFDLFTKLSIISPICNVINESLYNLKIKRGMDNYTSICWTSGTDNKWDGLTDIINELNKIYELNFKNITDKYPDL